MFREQGVLLLYMVLPDSLKILTDRTFSLVSKLNPVCAVRSILCPSSETENSWRLLLAHNKGFWLLKMSEEKVTR